MCSGLVLLAALGILKGQSAATYPTSFQLLNTYCVNVIRDQHIVVSNNIATAAHCSAAVDLMGWAILKLYIAEVMNKVLESVMPLSKT